jgi:hypothetical protein
VRQKSCFVKSFSARSFFHILYFGIFTISKRQDLGLDETISSLARSWHRRHHRRHHRAFHAEPHEGVLVAARHVRALVWQLLAQRIHRLPDDPLTAALAAPEAAVAPMRCRHAMCERCHVLDAQDGAFFVVEPESGRYVHPGLTLCLEACLLNLVRTVGGAMRRPTASAAASVELATTRSMSARSRWPEPSESNLSN